MRPEPKGKLIKTNDAKHDERFHTYENWDFYWHTGFTTIPMCRWEWWPDCCWGDWERAFRFLWLTFAWSKSWTYRIK